jgi:hypothetical protein
MSGFVFNHGNVLAMDEQPLDIHGLSSGGCSSSQRTLNSLLYNVTLLVYSPHLDNPHNNNVCVYTYYGFIFYNNDCLPLNGLHNSSMFIIYVSCCVFVYFLYVTQRYSLSYCFIYKNTQLVH